MNSKRSVYLLVPLVALVWGLIAWRIWSAANPTDSPASQLPLTVLPKAAAVSARRPVLLLTYGDPFKPVAGSPVSRPAGVLPTAGAAGTSAGPAYRAPAPRLDLPVRPVTPPLPAAPAVVWPAVKYLGVITHANGQAQVALLSIDKEEAVVKVGKSTRGIQVVRLFRDSVQLSLNRQKKSFYRELGN